MDLADRLKQPAAGVHPVPHVSITVSGVLGAVHATAGARDRKDASPGHQVTTPDHPP